jgi:hypothetical protein
VCCVCGDMNRCAVFVVIRIGVQCLW